MSQLLTVPEVAATLRLSERTVRRRIATGDLPAWRLGVESRAALRIHERALEAFMRPAAQTTTKETRTRV